MLWLLVGLIVSLLTTSLLSDRGGEEGCRWVRVTNVDTQHFDAVYFSTDCEHHRGFAPSNHHSKKVQFVFVEIGGAWSPHVPAISGNDKFRASDAYTDYLGLKTDNAWSYRRVYASLADFDCRSADTATRSSEIFDREHERWRCFVSGAVAARWVGSPVHKTYSLGLTLPVGHRYTISAVSGLDGCMVPLETLGIFDLQRCPNVSTACPRLCSEHPSSGLLAANTSALLLAQFALDLRTSTGEDVSVSPSVGATSGCRWYGLSGAYVAGTWVSPFACPLGPPYKNRQQGTDSVVPPPKAKLDTLCVVGDSHIVRARRQLKEAAARAGLHFAFEGNYVQGLNLTVPLQRAAWHPKTLSLLGSMDQCLRPAPAASTAMVWWFGSHAHALSPSEVAETVAQVHSHIIRTRVPAPGAGAGAGAGPCVLVVGALDSMFEHTPALVGEQMRYYQNSWRVAAQNAALQKAVLQHSGAGTGEDELQFHYIDVFEQSLALHFDGHTRADPVHFSSRFYDRLARQIVSAVTDMCV
jgi:hypothetical protein